jgi:hypothetical protein
MTDALIKEPEEIVALKQHSAILAKSGLLPDHFKKYPAAVYTVASLARSIGEDPVQLAQACYFVGGKMGLASAYLLGRLRRTAAIRGTVRYIIEGEGETLSVRAQVIDAETGETIIGPAATYEMAKADGWTKNPKYKTMPEIMLRNRALSFLVRYHYPDATAGLPTADELRDIEAAKRGAAAVRTGALAAIEAECSDTEEHLEVDEPAETEDEERRIGYEDTETAELFEAGA